MMLSGVGCPMHQRTGTPSALVLQCVDRDGGNHRKLRARRPCARASSALTPGAHSPAQAGIQPDLRVPNLRPRWRLPSASGRGRRSVEQFARGEESMTIGALPCLTNRIAARTAFVLICLLGPVSERAPVRLVGTAQAQVTTQPQTQTVHASSYTMPPGAVPPPVMGPPVTIPRPGSPLSDAELERLKNLPGGPPTPGATPIPPARSQAPQPNAAQPPDVVTTCPTNSTDGGGPPDIIGAAGPFTIVVTTNVSIGVYSTDCHLSSKVSLKDFFGPTGVASNETLFDSRVIYDPGVGRFFVTSESATTFKGDPTDYQNQYFAVSQDQTGTSWWLYKVVLKSPSTLFCVQANALWDFPSAGSMNGAKPRWFITANQVPGLGRLQIGRA